MLDETIKARLFDPRSAFESPITIGILISIVVALAVSKLTLIWGTRTKRFSSSTIAELNARLNSWVILVFGIVVPILAGAATTVLAVWILCILCYREYANTVGILDNRMATVVVVFCSLILAFASIDHFDRLYFATSSLGVGLLVILSVIEDRPSGFITRTALSVFGFLLFGYSMSYLALMTNTPSFRPLLLSIILAVEANDIAAFCFGRTLRGPKLIPQTSPGKTISGAVGAVCFTSLLVAFLFHVMYAGTSLDRWWLLAALGILISVVGQLGDLALSSIKRDVGIKDFGNILPGHGGWLDRFDSLVMVPPVVYHFISLFAEPIGSNMPVRIIAGVLLQ